MANDAPLLLLTAEGKESRWAARSRCGAGLFKHLHRRQFAGQNIDLLMGLLVAGQLDQLRTTMGTNRCRNVGIELFCIVYFFLSERTAAELCSSTSTQL
jgi:hypothetical protein